LLLGFPAQVGLAAAQLSLLMTLASWRALLQDDFRWMGFACSPGFPGWVSLAGGFCCLASFPEAGLAAVGFCCCWLLRLAVFSSSRIWACCVLLGFAVEEGPLQQQSLLLKRVGL